MTSSNVTRQQALLDRATVCLRLLRDNPSNPDNERTLECLRELWKKLALEIWLLRQAEFGELKALSDVQASIIAAIVDAQGRVEGRRAKRPHQVSKDRNPQHARARDRAGDRTVLIIPNT
jgi:hypothetical protein